MTFPNQKKTYLEKLDRSRKGELDQQVLPLISLINQQQNYYTTSSCSGRIVLWSGTGKKDETKWIKVSHEKITSTFFNNIKEEDLVWLRLEPFIIHISCQDLDSANQLLQQAQQLFKKSSLLSFSNKIIVEIKGSEFIELPLIKNQQFLLKEEQLPFLTELCNQKLAQIHQKTDRFSSLLAKNL